MKKVSVSAELAVIQRSVDAAALLIEVGRQGGVGDEDVEALASAVLALSSCRIRDLGRAVRGTFPAALLAADHNAVITGTGEDDLLVPPPRPPKRNSRA